MAVSTRDLPDTMVSPETGETLRRGGASLRGYL